LLFFSRLDGLIRQQTKPLAHFLEKAKTAKRRQPNKKGGERNKRQRLAGVTTPTTTNSIAS
jgi:hypothetical protein